MIVNMLSSGVVLDGLHSLQSVGRNRSSTARHGIYSGQHSTELEVVHTSREYPLCHQQQEFPNDSLTIDAAIQRHGMFTNLTIINGQPRTRCSAGERVDLQTQALSYRIGTPPNFQVSVVSIRPGTDCVKCEPGTFQPAQLPHLFDQCRVATTCQADDTVAAVANSTSDTQCTRPKVCAHGQRSVLSHGNAPSTPVGTDLACAPCRKFERASVDGGCEPAMHFCINACYNTNTTKGPAYQIGKNVGLWKAAHKVHFQFRRPIAELFANQECIHVGISDAACTPAPELQNALAHVVTLLGTLLEERVSQQMKLYHPRLVNAQPHIKVSHVGSSKRLQVEFFGDSTCTKKLELATVDLPNIVGEESNDRVQQETRFNLTFRSEIVSRLDVAASTAGTRFPPVSCPLRYKGLVALLALRVRGLFSFFVQVFFFLVSLSAARCEFGRLAALLCRCWVGDLPRQARSLMRVVGLVACGACGRISIWFGRCWHVP